MGKRKYKRHVKKKTATKPPLPPLEFPVGSQEYVRIRNLEFAEAKKALQNTEELGK